MSGALATSAPQLVMVETTRLAPTHESPAGVMTSRQPPRHALVEQHAHARPLARIAVKMPVPPQAGTAVRRRDGRAARCNRKLRGGRPADA